MVVQSLGREDSPGGRHGNPLQYSCLANPMDRGAWQATACRVIKELDTTEVIQHVYLYEFTVSFSWLSIFKEYLKYLFIWLHWVLVAACGI